MRRGRAWRHRKRQRNRPQTETRADTCAVLRKWMVSQSSKRQLMETLDLVPFYFPETGRGLKTKKEIVPGSVVVSIPLCLLVTPSVVLNSQLGELLKKWKVTFTPHQLLTLFLIMEQKKGETSKWHPFVSSLPSEYNLPHYFSATEISYMPCHLSLLAQRMVDRTRLAHKQTLRFCSEHWNNACDWLSWERFCWAWCTVSSRAVFFESEENVEQFMDLGFKDENNVALCPYLDLLNHMSTARVHAGFNRQKETYEIITQDSYRPHEQVYISYGAHDNSTLFLHYGFTLPNNVHNKVSFSIEDFGELQTVFKQTCWEQKIADLRKNNLDRGLSCTMDGISWNLMSALKVLSMNWQQLQKSERVLTGETLPREIMVTATQMAKHLISKLLKKSQTLLNKIPPLEGLSERGLIARSLLMDDIHILTVALHDVN